MMKTIVISCVLTFSLCASLVGFGWELMLKEMGLQAIPSKQFVQYKKSHQRLVKAKHHQRVKQKQLKQRFIKRATKKVLASSAAALTVGTIGVAATAATLEAVDYCEQLEDAEEWKAVLAGKSIEEKSFADCAENEAAHVEELLSEVKRQGSLALRHALTF